MIPQKKTNPTYLPYVCAPIAKQCRMVGCFVTRRVLFERRIRVARPTYYRIFSRTYYDLLFIISMFIFIIISISISISFLYIYIYLFFSAAQVTDMCSFYHLPSTVIGHDRHRTLNAAYSFYNVATTVRPVNNGL